MTEEQYNKAASILNEIRMLQDCLSRFSTADLPTGIGGYAIPLALSQAYTEAIKDDMHHKLSLLQAELAAI